MQLIQKNKSDNKALNDSEYSLHWHCAHGNLDKVKEIVTDTKFEPDALNTLGRSGHTPLQLAAINGHKKIVYFLVRQPNINVNATFKSQNKGLNNITVLDLITYRLVLPDKEGWLNKIFTKWNKYIEILEILLDHLHSTHPDRINESLSTNGDNLFHKLIGNIDLEKFQLLYNSKNQHIKQLLNLRNSEGLTTLGLAIKKYDQANLNPKSHKHLKKIINILANDDTIKGYSKINKNNYNDNELHLIVRLHSNKNLSENKKKFLEKIAKKLIDLVDLSNNEQQTPLHIAMTKNNLKMVKILLNYTNLTMQDINGNTPLHLMVNSLEIVQYLIGQIKTGKTPFSHIKKAFYELKNQKEQDAFHCFFEKIATSCPENPQLGSYTDCFYLLDKYHSGPSKAAYEFKHEVTEGIRPTKGLKINQEKEKCTICFEDITNRRVEIKSCGHSFHPECFVRLCYNYMINQKEEENPLSCPLCRTPIFNKD